MPRPRLEVADIVRRYGPAYRAAHACSRTQQRVLRALATCRTAALGGHLEQCDTCGHQRPAYNSCANRHCPKCQALARARWLDARRADLLDVEYFHVVFTVPEPVAAMAYQNKAVVYGILFRTTAATLRTLAADPQHLGATLGFLAVLHTWGQTLGHHPHLHCVVPGGGLAPDGTRWIACRPGFFLPVRVLSRLFRRLFLAQLQAAYARGQLHFAGTLAALADPAAFARALGPLAATEWVVYAKPPFGGPAQVLEYLGQYTHRVAIANHRLLSLDAGQVRFRWKDYRHHGRPKTMTLDAAEFLRRFLLHVLPAGFHRIRHYGFLGNRHRARQLARCRALLAMPPAISAPATPRDYRDVYEALTGVSLRVCPACQEGRMVRVGTLPPAPRAPPGGGS
jgi:putative transposase/transposase-like zinc-binding protein